MRFPPQRNLLAVIVPYNSAEYLKFVALHPFIVVFTLYEV